jgi:hypothetical protein
MLVRPRVEFVLAIVEQFSHRDQEKDWIYCLSLHYESKVRDIIDDEPIERHLQNVRNYGTSKRKQYRGLKTEPCSSASVLSRSSRPRH